MAEILLRCPLAKTMCKPTLTSDNTEGRGKENTDGTSPLIRTTKERRVYKIRQSQLVLSRTTAVSREQRLRAGTWSKQDREGRERCGANALRSKQDEWEAREAEDEERRGTSLRGLQR